MSDIIDVIRELRKEFYYSCRPNGEPSVLTMDYDSWYELMSDERVQMLYGHGYQLREPGPDRFMDLTIGILRDNPSKKPFIKVT